MQGTDDENVTNGNNTSVIISNTQGIANEISDGDARDEMQDITLLDINLSDEFDDSKDPTYVQDCEVPDCNKLIFMACSRCLQNT